MAEKKKGSVLEAWWALPSWYDRFEHAVIFILTIVIAVLVVIALWDLVLRLVVDVRTQFFDVTEYTTYQSYFGMILTVIIALEFKRSLLVATERVHDIVRLRTVVLIALLAIVRKLVILDLANTSAETLFALAAAIVALGCVFWLVREQDRRDAA